MQTCKGKNYFLKDTYFCNQNAKILNMQRSYFNLFDVNMYIYIQPAAEYI